MAGPAVARANTDYFPAYRHHDGNLREVVIVRACLGHTCPCVSLGRVGPMVDRGIMRDLAMRQRGEVPFVYYVAPQHIMQAHRPDRGGVTDEE
eukprot:7991513-Alexandrium_andersonii.AAC.1